MQDIFVEEYYKNYRLVIRTLASSTNERSMISSIIPQNSFFTNSLCGICIFNERKEKSIKYALLLQSFFNSFTVDYFLRQRVSSNINKKFIVQLNIPRLTKRDRFFEELIQYSANLTCTGRKFNKLADEIGISRGGVTEKLERRKIQAKIDAMVAYSYGLSKEEYAHVLSTFKTGNNQERLNNLKDLSMKSFDNLAEFKKTA